MARRWRRPECHKVRGHGKERWCPRTEEKAIRNLPNVCEAICSNALLSRSKEFQQRV